MFTFCQVSYGQTLGVIGYSVIPLILAVTLLPLISFIPLLNLAVKVSILPHGTCTNVLQFHVNFYLFEFNHTSGFFTYFIYLISGITVDYKVINCKIIQIAKRFCCQQNGSFVCKCQRKTPCTAYLLK